MENKKRIQYKICWYFEALFLKTGKSCFQGKMKLYMMVRDDKSNYTNKAAAQYFLNRKNDKKHNEEVQ